MVCQNIPSHRLGLSFIQTGARLVKTLSPRDDITPFLHQLHWFPIQAQISYLHIPIRFKICQLAFKVKSGSAPPYMSSLVIPSLSVALESRQGLRSASKGDFVVKRAQLQFGNRMFEVAGPVEWNSLPEPIRRSSSKNTFENKLKTFLFLC